MCGEQLLSYCDKSKRSRFAQKYIHYFPMMMIFCLFVSFSIININKQTKALTKGEVNMFSFGLFVFSFFPFSFFASTNK